jgi:hypothetical protein
MKRIIVFLSILVVPFMFNSCKKSSTKPATTNGTYYVKLKINGVAKSMTLTPIAMFTDAQTIHIGELTGYFAGNFGEGAIFTITDGDPITTNKAYTQQRISANGTSVIQNLFIYRGDDGKQYLANGDDPGTSVTLTFTEITSGYVKGTFSGTLWLQGSNSTFVNITDGEFYLRRP